MFLQEEKNNADKINKQYKMMYLFPCKWNKSFVVVKKESQRKRFVFVVFLFVSLVQNTRKMPGRVTCF